MNKQKNFFLSNEVVNFSEHNWIFSELSYIFENTVSEKIQTHNH